MLLETELTGWEALGSASGVRGDQLCSSALLDWAAGHLTAGVTRQVGGRPLGVPRDPSPGDASSWSRSRGSTAPLWTVPAPQPPGRPNPAGQPPWTGPHGRWILVHRCPHCGAGTILTTFWVRNPTLRSHPRSTPGRAACDGPTGAWEPCALWACSSRAPHPTDRRSSSRILQPLTQLPPSAVCGRLSLAS